MKNLLILLSFLLTSCGCLLSQIPPQRIYAGAGCTAILPNYLSKITASDNCEIASFTQTPAPGYQLTPTNKTTTVTVKATDASGNFRQIVFTVTLLDTIKPILTVDPSLLALQLQQVTDIYDYGDKLFSFIDENLSTIYNNASWVDSIPGFKDHLLSGDYHTKALVNISYQKPDGTREHDFNFVDRISVFTKFK